MSDGLTLATPMKNVWLRPWAQYQIKAFTAGFPSIHLLLIFSCIKKSKWAKLWKTAAGAIWSVPVTAVYSKCVCSIRFMYRMVSTKYLNYSNYDWEMYCKIEKNNMKNWKPYLKYLCLRKFCSGAWMQYNIGGNVTSVFIDFFFYVLMCRPSVRLCWLEWLWWFWWFLLMPLLPWRPKPTR